MSPELAFATGFATGIVTCFVASLACVSRRADDDGARAIRLLREQRGVRTIRLHEYAEYNTGGETWRRN